MNKYRQSKHASTGATARGIRAFHCFLATILAVGASAAISQQPTVVAPTQSNVQQAGISATGNPTTGISAANFPNFGSQAGKTGPFDRAGAEGEMIGFTTSDGSGSQTITLVHTGKSWMAVVSY